MAIIGNECRERTAQDCRVLIAQALAEGLDERGIHDRLLALGVSEEQTVRELAHARTDPFFLAARHIAIRLSNRIEKRNWTLGIHARLAAANPEALSIPTVEAIEPERFYREFYFANRPVKLRGLVDHWPALHKWTLDHLEAELGDSIVEVQGQRTGAKTYETNKEPHRRQVPLRGVIQLLRRNQPSNDYYITAYNDTVNKTALAPLWADLGAISLLRSTGERDGFFWLGPAGTLTPFHHDLTNNLLVQIEGRKHVRMVPSWEVERMRNTLHCFSEREPEDFERGGDDLPPILECVIDKGEAIFLPIGWWHHVTALDCSISMSFTNFSADNHFTAGYPADARF